VNIRELRRTLEVEIDNYVYEPPSGLMGIPMPVEWVTAQLAEMRAALVDPHPRMIAISDSVPQLLGKAAPVLRECILVADDRQGYELYFDPVTNDFVLAYSGDPPKTFNVRGDAVRCFLAR
jgi:hypothetical protein